MNNNRENKGKIYLKIVAAVVVAVFTVLFLRFLVRGNAGNWIVAFMEKRFHMHPWQAQQVYQVVIRNNLDFIVISAMAANAFIVSGLILWYTHRKRIKEEKRLEKRKNEIITFLAHDIKTPLTSVIGYQSLLNEKQDMSREDRVKHIRVALEKAYYLEGLVNEFFEISQYNLQSISLSKKDINLYFMLIQLVDEAYPLLTAFKKGAAIHADEGLRVYADPNKIGRVLSNILKNAICYGEGNIDISAKAGYDMVEIEFKNVGVIPRDKLEVIFDKFYRMDEARSSKTGGSGLGLAIAREIVLLHGGTIKAESKNGYTIFSVCIPKGKGIKS